MNRSLAACHILMVFLWTTGCHHQRTLPPSMRADSSLTSPVGAAKGSVPASDVCPLRTGVWRYEIVDASGATSKPSGQPPATSAHVLSKSSEFGAQYVLALDDARKEFWTADADGNVAMVA